jgi:predicted nucleic acid-binding protein
VLDETITLCRYECGHDVALRVASRLLDGKSVHLARIGPDDESAALRLFRERPDKTDSFTDCTSFVMMRRLGLDKAVSTDADFRQEGFETLP